MLQVKNISKQYRTGNLIQNALNGVELNFRDSEFVSVLGPSGSGKTTLLNIIGGLDRYDSGDLIIDGTSTKKYKDSDWDYYRNHMIGFVFQNYNLIPHQSILANVELALTIGGVSRSERRKRAKKALIDVGLADQLHKKPNQLSGGQMQRVAIARALVNNPKILLADEPTGALDSETGIKVMELLKEIAKDRLVIMVTHNPELAERYSSRTVNLKDGRIVDDSAPFTAEKDNDQYCHKNKGSAKMSFLTSLSLSFNNLLTKKGRTILTAFAGSIGIIGIALILALSNGVNTYISDVQRETMTSYPITVTEQSVDMVGLMGTRGNLYSEDETSENTNGVRADYSALKNQKAMTSNIKENNLTEFKKYLDDSSSEINRYLGEYGVIYTYGVSFKIYSYDENGKLVSSDTNANEISALEGPKQQTGGPMANISAITGNESLAAENFSELMRGIDSAVSPVVSDNYDILYGELPTAFDEVVLVLDKNSSLPADVLYQLGFITEKQYKKITDNIRDGEPTEEVVMDYSEVCGHRFYMLPACEHYSKNADGTFTYVTKDIIQIESLINNAVELKISGIIRPKKDATDTSISSAVGYTALLTDYIIEHTDKSAVVKAQERNPETNVLNGMPFEAADDKERTSAAAKYISEMDISEKADFFSVITRFGGQSNVIPPELSDNEVALAGLLDQWLENSPDEELLLSVYDEFVGDGSYEKNMELFGKVSRDAPSSISIYTDSFEDKDAVSDCITRYNENAAEENKITYTDYVAILTGSVTTIVNVISYVLIAFVAVSLIVSSIMIGIITHISVLERTKEIGILRALGASKRNISQVFNAETIIIGLLAGVLGVSITMLLSIPINVLIHNFMGAALSASLPAAAALILVLLSVGVTVIAGLIPAKNAANKDPVTALHTE